MELLLKRHIFGECYTQGTLYLDGERFCDTLEPRDAKLEQYTQKSSKGFCFEMPAYIDTVAFEKSRTANQCAIPRGVYIVSVSKSKRFRRVLPMLENVPYFSGIRIHMGNTHKDTSGCILVGEFYKHDEIRMSRNYELNLSIKLENYIHSHPMDVVTIEIV